MLKTKRGEIEMIIPQKYIEMRQNLKYNSVSLGYTEVYIFACTSVMCPCADGAVCP